jgi:hypothetical protein
MDWGYPSNEKKNQSVLDCAKNFEYFHESIHSEFPEIINLKN